MRKELSEAIKAAPNYRAFLRAYMGYKYAARKITYAELAQKAGMNSKGFIGDLLNGKKRMTLTALPKINNALGISGLAKKIFESLVYLEEKDLRPLQLAHLSNAEIAATVEALKRRLPKERMAKNFDGRRMNSIHLYLVFSALGSRETGATILNLEQRTGLSPRAVSDALQLLEKEALVSLEGDRYFALADDLDFSELGFAKGFQDVYLSALGRAQKKASEMANFPNDLYMFCAVPVNQAQQQELKSALRRAVLDVLDSWQVDDGDSVKSICLSLF